jgi:type IV pilus assembly protein PilP
LASLLLTGCAGDMHDLEAYVAEVKMRKPPGIEPLPEIKPYEKFEYQAEDLRNPFDPSVIAQQPAAVGNQVSESGISPDPNRTPEFLESFPLDTLRMVGTLEQSGQLWALIKTPDATIQRVAQGNYMGQNNGKITLISEANIKLMEIVPDGFGGWREREGLVALSD